MKAGAVDCQTKPVEREPLLAAVRAALARDGDAGAARAERAARSECHGLLTPREREVFDRVIAGRLSKQIAGALGTSERTVKAHRSRVVEKMGAGSVADLVRMAERLRGAP